MELENIYRCVLEGDRDQIKALVERAIEAEIDPEQIINESLIKGMDEVGQKMKEGEIFVPEVLMAANTMKAGLEIVKPLLTGDKQTRGIVAIGTVAGDLHDIGKNLVAMMLEGAGFTVIDLGIDVSKERFLSTIEENKPDIIGLSALLTTTMETMKEIVKEIDGKAKTLIGGAPVTEEFAKEIGADGYAPDAAIAVDVAKNLIGIN